MAKIKQTDFTALCIIGQMVRNFEKLHFLQIQNKDRTLTQKARAFLEKIIQENGYRISYRTEQPITKNELLTL